MSHEPSQAQYGLTADTSALSLPLGDIIDLIYFLLFDSEFWSRSRDGRRRNNENQSLHRRMAFDTLTEAWRVLPDPNVHSPPVARAIAKYGRSFLINQVKKYLVEPIMSHNEHPGMRRISYMDGLARTLASFNGTDAFFGRSFLPDGIYLRLIRRAWMVMKSDLDVGEVCSALHHTMFESWR